MSRIELSIKRQFTRNTTGAPVFSFVLLIDHKNSDLPKEEAHLLIFARFYWGKTPNHIAKAETVCQEQNCYYSARLGKTGYGNYPVYLVVILPTPENHRLRKLVLRLRNFVSVLISPLA